MKALKSIQVWMAVKGLSARKIANGSGRSETFMSLFLKGDRTSQGMVDYLTNKGCPKCYFKNGRVAK